MTTDSKTAHGRQVERVLWIVLVLNLVVAASKYFYGLASGASCRRGAPLRPFQVRDLRFARHRRAAPLRRLRSRLLGCGEAGRRHLHGSGDARVLHRHGGNPRGEPVRDLVRAPCGQAAQERDPRG